LIQINTVNIESSTVSHSGSADLITGGSSDRRSEGARRLKHVDREESNINHKIEDGILHVTVEGSVTVSDIVAYAQNHIEVWARYDRVLWDFGRALFPYITSGTLSGLSDKFGTVSQAQKMYWHSAIVVREVNELSGNFIVGLSEVYSLPVEYQAFFSLDEARRWLQSV